MNTLNKVVRKNESIAYRIIEGEALLVSPADNLIYPLNPVATRIWELLDNKRETHQIISIVSEEFDALPATIQNDTVSFIDELASKGLVVIGNE
ncbi:MAG: PqqD family protein [Planctomycetota bacterium]